MKRPLPIRASEVFADLKKRSLPAKRVNQQSLGVWLDNIADLYPHTCAMIDREANPFIRMNALVNRLRDDSLSVPCLIWDEFNAGMKMVNSHHLEAVGKAAAVMEKCLTGMGDSGDSAEHVEIAPKGVVEAAAHAPDSLEKSPDYLSW